MKRFWTNVDVVAGEAGFDIQLDGRAVRTPARHPLTLPTAALAEAVAAEWQAQESDIIPANMPFTGFANAAIDIITPDPAAFAAQLSAYGVSELLCYRAPEAPLAAEEGRLWNPILTWAEGRYGVSFNLTAGIMPVEQEAETLAILDAAVAALPPFRLSALSPLVSIGGSLVIALAIEDGALDPEAAWTAVTLDEIWQEERWGAVDDAVELRERRKVEWDNAVAFLSLT